MKTEVQRPVTVAVLMTCFNRREQTLSCLQRLFAQEGQETFRLAVFLVDDRSPDGTAEAVQTRFPAVEVMHGTGSLFWNGGMRAAFARALPLAFDFYLWLNDDTEMYPGALQHMLATYNLLAKSGLIAMVAGSTRDKENGRASYGGQRWLPGPRRRLVLVEPDTAEPAPCDTVNGNCTLISQHIARTVGNLDTAFTHSFGDLDYGFRAQQAGFSCYVAPGFVGTCSDNSRSGTWRDRSISMRQRWKHLTSPKGSPFAEWALYCWRHLGALWPLYAVSPYVKIVASSVLGEFLA